MRSGIRGWIGKIDEGDWFLVGSFYTSNIDLGGELILAINDDIHHWNNTGSFTITVGIENLEGMVTILSLDNQGHGLNYELLENR